MPPSEPPVVVDLLVPADHRFLATTRRALEGYLGDLGLPGEVVTDVTLAAAEAWANVLQHAFPDGGGTLRVVVEATVAEVSVEVRDRGVGFNALELPSAPRGRMSETGRGIEIMRRLVSEVHVESPADGGGTRVQLRRRVGPASRPGAGERPLSIAEQPTGGPRPRRD